MSVRQYDTASSPLPPAPADAAGFAGYFNGIFLTYLPLRDAHPGLPVLAISVRVPTVAELLALRLRQVCFDVERFDIRPVQIGECLAVAHAAGIPCPVVYGSLDTWFAVGGLVDQLHGQRRGVNYQGWLAHPNGIEAIPAGFAAKQFLFGNDWDTSSVADPETFYNLAPPSHPTPENIVAIAAAPNQDGRIEVFVEAADGSLWHTYQLQDNGGWSGGKPGVRVAQLTPLTPPPGQ